MAKNKVEITGIKTSSLETLKSSEMTKLFEDMKNGVK